MLTYTDLNFLDDVTTVFCRRRSGVWPNVQAVMNPLVKLSV